MSPIKVEFNKPIEEHLDKLKALPDSAFSFILKLMVEVFQESYGESFDFKMVPGGAKIFLDFKDYIVSNSEGHWVKLKRLFFVICVSKDGIDFKIITPDSYVKHHYYGHSHSQSIEFNDENIINNTINTVCLGSSFLSDLRGLINLDLQVEDCSELTREDSKDGIIRNLELLCLTIQEYVSHESLEGGPYRKIKDVFRIKGINDGIEAVKSRFKTLLPIKSVIEKIWNVDFVQEILKDLEISVEHRKISLKSYNNYVLLDKLSTILVGEFCRYYIDFTTLEPVEIESLETLPTDHKFLFSEKTDIILFKEEILKNTYEFSAHMCGLSKESMNRVLGISNKEILEDVDTSKYVFKTPKQILDIYLEELQLSINFYTK